MITIKEIVLLEISNSNYSDLYHWSSIEKIQRIIHDDTMYGKFKHIINRKEYVGNSLSRNNRMIITNYNIRITLDQEKLKHNYRMFTVDAEIIHRKIDVRKPELYPSRIKINDRSPNKTNTFGDSPIKKDFNNYIFAEEFILGDIKNVHKYIKEIKITDNKNWMVKKLSNKLIENLKWYCNKFDIPLIVQDNIKMVK